MVEKFIFQLEAQLADRGVMIELSEDAAKWIAEKGYDEKFGARPLARVIQEYIKKPLADELLFGKLEHGGTVKVVVTGKGEERALSFEYLPADPASGPRPRARTRTTRTSRRRSSSTRAAAQGAAEPQGQERALAQEYYRHGAFGAPPQGRVIAIGRCRPIGSDTAPSSCAYRSSRLPSRPARSWMNCQATRPERAPRVMLHSSACRASSSSLSFSR